MSIKLLYVYLLIFYFKICKSSELHSTEYKLNNTQCEQDFDYYFENVMNYSTWALKMFDSSSKIQSGLLTGNLIDLGNYDECVGVEYVSNDHKINGQYCQLVVNWTISGNLPKRINSWNVEISKNMARVLANVNSVPGPIIAICVPHTCSAEDTRIYLTQLLKKPIPSLILKQIGLTKDKIDHLFHMDQNTCQVKNTVEWKTLDYFTIAFLSVIAVICVISTAYDVYLKYSERKTPYQILIAFSIYTNGSKLFSISNNPDQLGCLHGLRFISMMWVILGHKFSSEVFQPYLNLTDISEWLNKLGNMYIIGAPVAVDTFFVLSGLLVAYITLKTMDKGQKLNIPLFYLHRYLRLTPALAVVILLNVSLLHMYGSGPYWKFGIDYIESTCKDYWWTTLLYVQNYVNPDKVCLAQSWYLSVDMQLFILSPILILPAWYWAPFTNVIIHAIIIFFSMLSPFLVTYIYQFGGLMLTGAPDYQAKYYMPLHTRFGPWVMGFTLGYYLFRIKTKRSRPIQMSPLTALIGWVLWICIMIVIIWAPNNFLWHQYDRWESSIYYCFFRNVWAAAICWVIYACVQGYGSIINWFLSSPLFQVLGRFSYSMYLIHASLQLVELISVRTTQYFTDYNILHSFWGDLVFTLGLSLILILMFESPMITIEKVIFSRGNNDKSTKSLQHKKNNQVTPEVVTHKYN